MINLKQFYDAKQAADLAVQQKAVEINALYEAQSNGSDPDGVKKAMALRPELDRLKAEAKRADEMYFSMSAAADPGSDPAQKLAPFIGNVREEESKDIRDLRGSKVYNDRFWEAMQQGVTPKSIKSGQHSSERFGPLLNALSETGGSPAGAEGGFGAPVEFDNKIIERMRQFIDLADGSARMANVENVGSNTGWRMIETAAAALPFDTLTELETLEDDEETESPTFSKIEYTVVDKGGFLRLSDDVVMDVPALQNYVARWFGRKAVLTKNEAVLAIMNAVSSTHVSDPANLLTALKTALNTTLDPEIGAAATIFCNQTGFDLLDKLEDDNGRPMLQPDPATATGKRCLGRDLVVLADRLWANLTAPTPDHTRIAIGALPEHVTLFQRLPYQFATTNIGGSAWRSFSSEMRAVMRIVAKEIDSGAMALLAVNVTSGS